MTGPYATPTPETAGPGDDPWLRWDAASREPEGLPLSKAAVTSLVFGIIGGILFAYVFGIVGLASTGKRLRSRRGRGFAWAGVSLATVWLAVLVAFVVWTVHREPSRDGEGHVDGGGTSSVFALHPGDCIPDPAALDHAVEADVVPCDQRHFGQVAATVALTDGVYADTAIRTEAEAECRTAVASALLASAPQDLTLTTLVPGAAAWDRGQRTALCVVVRDKALVSSVVQS